MPLNWSIKNCKDWETLKSDDEWPVTNALIWVSMSVGLSEITEENLPEYYARLAMWQDLAGDLGHVKDATTGKWKSGRITQSDLRKRIGLSTNASTMTRTQWRKNLNQYIDRELENYVSYCKPL